MSYSLDKDILKLEEEIKAEENKLTKVNILINKLPKKNDINKKGTESSQMNLELLMNISDIIVKIDKLNEIENPIEKLYELNSLFQSQKIPNLFLKKMILNKMINDDILKIIEESLFNIKYPLFQGKHLMSNFEQLGIDNKKDLEILASYFEIYSQIAQDLYQEFPNYGVNNDLIIKNNKNDNENEKLNFTELLIEFLYRKILLTIFDDKNNNLNVINDDDLAYKNELDSNEKNLLNKYEKLISYLNKAISNTSELFSLIINQNNNNKNLNKNIFIRYIISNLSEKLILFFFSEKASFDIDNSSMLFIILLIQKTNEQMDEFNKNYQYNSFNNISFHDFIKYYINNNQTEIDIINRQKQFDNEIISKLKKNMIDSKNIEINRTEEFLEYINLIIKDIIGLFETFRNFNIIKDLLIFSCSEILKIFDDFYNKQLSLLTSKTASLEEILFLANLLFNFLNLCNNEFNSFIERINLYNFKEKIKDTLAKFNNKVDNTYKNFQYLILDKIKFDKIIILYRYENLKKGYNLDHIKNIFNEENNFWINVRIILDKIKASKEIINYIMNSASKAFVKDLSKCVLNDIEKGDIEGKNLDVLIDKTKYFLENNFINEDIIDEENQKNIIKLYSYLDNLYLNKK